MGVCATSSTAPFVLSAFGTRSAQPPLFAGIAWGTKTVLAETRARIIEQRLILTEQPPLWDVDTENDLARLEREYPELKL